MKTTKLQQQLPLNIAGNIAYFIINLIIGLLLVPYFLKTLGTAAYGLIPLATSLNSYMGLITQSMNTAISRYLTVDLQREDYKNANKTYNTAFFGISSIILIILPIVLIISIYAPILFNVPPDQTNGVVFLFLGVNSAFLIRSWSGNFTVSLFAYNRLDLLNLVNIVNVIVQVVLIVLFFTLAAPSLPLIGLAYLFGAISASILAITLSRKINPHLKINTKDFDRSRLHDLTGMGIWVIINQLGSTLIIPAYLIVVNILFGATSAGEFAIPLQFVHLLYAVAGTLSSVITPVIFTYYAKGQTENVIRISKSSVKLMGIFMALPIGLICGFAPNLLTVWVGKEYSFLSLLMILLTGHLTISLSAMPLVSINVAYDKMKIQALITFLTGIANILLAIALSIFTSWGYYGVAVASAIIFLLKNAVLTPWYVTRVLKIPTLTYTGSMILGVIATILIAICAATFTLLFHLNTLLPLVIVSGGICVIYLSITIVFGLDRFEKNLFQSYFKKGE